MSRVAVFVDYQNMYHGARRAFGDPAADAPSFGHLHPAALARLLADLGRAVDPGRVLVATSVYRGEPGRLSHRKLRTSFARQTSRWRADPTVTVRTTPLRYRRDMASGATVWRAEEKGIDVLLAVDVVRGCYVDDFDTAVVASADTDLVPRSMRLCGPASGSRPPHGRGLKRASPLCGSQVAAFGTTVSITATSQSFRTPPTTWPGDDDGRRRFGRGPEVGNSSGSRQAGPAPNRGRVAPRRLVKDHLDGMTVLTRTSCTITPTGSVSV